MSSVARPSGRARDARAELDVDALVLVPARRAQRERVRVGAARPAAWRARRGRRAGAARAQTSVSSASRVALADRLEHRLAGDAAADDERPHARAPAGASQACRGRAATSVPHSATRRRRRSRRCPARRSRTRRARVPRIVGRKNPPSPPAAPTRPVSIPIRSRVAQADELEDRAVADAEARPSRAGTRPPRRRARAARRRTAAAPRRSPKTPVSTVVPPCAVGQVAAERAQQRAERARRRRRSSRRRPSRARTGRGRRSAGSSRGRRSAPNVTAYRPHRRQASRSRSDVAQVGEARPAAPGAGGSLASSANATQTSTTGISASPKTACQPTCSAIRGAASVVSTVPELPAPAIPIARPWWRGG